MSEDFLQPQQEDDVSVVDPKGQMPGLPGYIRGKLEDAEKARYAYEQRWLQAYKNFRGIYDSTTQYRDSERSKVFIKTTCCVRTNHRHSIRKQTISNRSRVDSYARRHC